MLMPGVGDVVLAAGAALLVIAGLPKVRDPLPVVRAMHSTGLPMSRVGARLLAIVEVLVGAWSLVAPHRASAAAVAGLYAAFTGFVLFARSRGGVVASCGCFGRADTPPTLGHASVTLLFSLGALMATVNQSPIALWRNGFAWESAAPVLAGAVIAFLAWIVMSVLPTVSAESIRTIQSRRGGQERTTGSV